MTAVDIDSALGGLSEAQKDRLARREVFGDETAKGLAPVGLLHTIDLDSEPRLLTAWEGVNEFIATDPKISKDDLIEALQGKLEVFYSNRGAHFVFFTDHRGTIRSDNVRRFTVFPTIVEDSLAIRPPSPPRGPAFGSNKPYLKKSKGRS